MGRLSFPMRKLQTQLIMCAHAHARSIYAHGMCAFGGKVQTCVIVTQSLLASRPTQLTCLCVAWMNNGQANVG